LADDGDGDDAGDGAAAADNDSTDDSADDSADDQDSGGIRAASGLVAAAPSHDA